MWESIKFFFKEVLRRAYVGILFVFLDSFDIFDRLIKPIWPAKWRNIDMPSGWGFMLFGLIILWAAFMAYHDLRKKNMAEFLEYAPEFKRDRIFRIFYELLKEGKFLKNTNTDTERRQQWDEKVLIEISKHCRVEFNHIYLLNTGRRNQQITPLEDNNYDKALQEIEKLLGQDFNLFVK